MAIQSFGNGAAARVAERQRLPALHPHVQKAAQRKLAMLGFAKTLDDLRSPPGNRLEKLHGDRGRAVQHPHQRPVAALLPLDPGRASRHVELVDYH